MNLEVVRMRESIAKTTHLLVGQDIRVTQEGSAAYVQADPATGRLARINIPLLPDDASVDLIRATQGYIDHEVGHVLFTDPSVIGLAANLGIRASHNIIEDLYIEREMERRFSGSRFNLDNLRELFCTDITPKLLVQAGQDEKRRFEVLAVQAARAMAGQERCQRFMEDGGHWNGKIMRLFVTALGPEVVARIPHLGSSAECLEVAGLWAAAMQTARECADAPPHAEQGTGLPDGSANAARQPRKSSGSRSAKAPNPEGAESSAGSEADHTDRCRRTSESDQDEKASGEKGEEDGDNGSCEQSGAEGAGADAGTDNTQADRSEGPSESNEHDERSASSSEDRGRSCSQCCGSSGMPGSDGDPGGPFDETEDGDQLGSHGEGAGKSSTDRAEPIPHSDRGGGIRADDAQKPSSEARPEGHEPPSQQGTHCKSGCAPFQRSDEGARDVRDQVLRPGPGGSWPNREGVLDLGELPVDPFGEAIQRAISDQVAATSSIYRIFTRERLLQNSGDSRPWFSVFAVLPSILAQSSVQRRFMKRLDVHLVLSRHDISLATA